VQGASFLAKAPSRVLKFSNSSAIRLEQTRGIIPLSPAGNSAASGSSTHVSAVPYLIIMPVRQTRLS